MKIKKITMAVVLLLSVLYGCKKEDALEPVDLTGLGGDKWVKNAYDSWIAENLTKPYNIEVKYKWDGTEVAMGYNLVPILESKVIPVLSAARTGWISPYDRVAGANFMKKYSQKEVVLIGTGQWLSNGTRIIGAAEGGRKISILEVNKFDKKNQAIVKEMLHTMHHEFGHILHQTIPFSPEYQRITPTDYEATWYNFTDAEARELGFMTAYSRSNKDDDFVELFSMMLVLGKTDYENILKTVESADGLAKLKKKEAIVRAYVKNAYGIDFDSLQTAVQEGIAEILK